MITEADALRAYPELAYLGVIRDAGWRFRHLTDDDGQLYGLVVARHWPGHTDALWIYGRTDTHAVRLLADAPGARGGLVWERTGTLADTAAALLELPAPGQPGAPALIRAPAPSLLEL